MAKPTRRIYVTDEEENALQRIVTAAEFSAATASPQDLVAVRRLLTKLKDARRKQIGTT